MVVVVVALKLRSLGFGFRAGREATRVNKLLPLPGRRGELEYRGRWIARGCGKEEREKRDRYRRARFSGVADSRDPTK